MNGLIFTFVVVCQLVDLVMTVVTGCDTVVRTGCKDLVFFQTTVFQACFIVAGLQIAAATTATVVVGTVGGHIDKIFFSDAGCYDKTQIFRQFITKAFSNLLARVLDSEFDL